MSDLVMNKIGVIDTSIASMNLGDFIIMDAANKVIAELYPESQKVYFPSHERITRVGLKRQREISKNILCGTNCLNSSMFLHRQWNVGFLNSILMRDVITLGVGWSNYQKKADYYTSLLLRSILDKKSIHSVRDDYTKNKLNECGVHNVINTSCPTMWSLTEEHCSLIPQYKARNVVFTLTDYRIDLEKDRNLISALVSSYENIYFWVQGSKDYAYFKSFNDLIGNIKIIPPILCEYDKLLKNNDSIDYVGTRLHAGIRAIQNKRRAFIVAVDNRAEEKRKDFNLNVIGRDLVINDYIEIFHDTYNTSIKIPVDNIIKWRGQFEK